MDILYRELYRTGWMHGEKAWIGISYGRTTQYDGPLCTQIRASTTVPYWRTEETKKGLDRISC
jgi:hypothetical protein